jgi:hypothetical protein
MIPNSHPSRTRRHPLLAAALLILPALASSAATIGYYRFDDASATTSDAPITEPVADVSGNARPIHPWNRPSLSTDVPLAVLPSGAANRSSVLIPGDVDLFSPPDEGLSRLSPENFTIETWVKFDALGGVQTFIGRDDVNEGAGRQSLFYLSKDADNASAPGTTPNGLRLELVTKDNTLLAINSAHAVQTGVWYHVAAVGDSAAGTLSLYADGRQIGQTSGFTGLFAPSHNGAWTFGRGQYNGRIADRFNGRLDEVRFSDEALPPERFLHAAPPPAAPAVAAAPSSPAPASPAVASETETTPEAAGSEKTARRRSGPSWPNRR